MSNGKVPITSIINKYPSHRDDFIKGPWKWLKGRRADDNAEGLWRVHDKLYNLKDFIKNHPGGEEWLTLTEGTDITEAFECYHIRNVASLALTKYYVKEASEPRNYTLTFDDDGFYRTLKRRCCEKLPTLDKSSMWKSKLIFDLSVVTLFAAAVMTVRCDNSALKILFGILTSFSFSSVITISHNFIHQRDSWRMYGSDLLSIGLRGWRIFHGLSHHLYPNTFTDFEITGSEPFLSFRPHPKSNLRIIFNVISPIHYLIFIHGFTISRWFGYLLEKNEKVSRRELLPLVLPLVMFLFGSPSLTWTNFRHVLILWQLLIVGGSFVYVWMALAAGHHGPTITHEGDEIKSLDFGIFQIEATIDRTEASSNLLMSLTLFGDHTLHHMFPSLDHSLLPQLRAIFLETCQEFEIELRRCSLFEAVIMKFQQLQRTETIKLQ